MLVECANYEVIITAYSCKLIYKDNTIGSLRENQEWTGIYAVEAPEFDFVMLEWETNGFLSSEKRNGTYKRFSMWIIDNDESDVAVELEFPASYIKIKGRDY